MQEVSQEAGHFYELLFLLFGGCNCYLQTEESFYNQGVAGHRELEKKSQTIVTGINNL